MIPKIIHYCWFGGTEKPDSVLKNIETWKTQCPSFEIKEWNESNYDVHKHPFMERALKDKMWSFVSDYARLEIIYENGGIYLDTDVEVIKDLSPLCEGDGFIGFETCKRVNDGQGFGAIKGLKVIHKMLEIYDREADSKDYIESPRLRTETLVSEGLVLNGQPQLVAGMKILPIDYLCPKDFYSGKIKITDNTYSIHHLAASWKNSKQKFYMAVQQFLYRSFGNKAGAVLFRWFIKFKDFVRFLMGRR